MVLEAAGWTLCAGVALVATARPLSWVLDNLDIKYRGFRARMRRVGVALGVGVAAIAVASQTIGRDSVADFTYSTPNTPTISAVVLDTTNIKSTCSNFVGSSDAVLDSVNFQIARVADTGFSTVLTETLIGAQVVDTLSDNTDLSADTTYILRCREKADPNKGGWSAWSAPDTFTNSNDDEPQVPSTAVLIQNWTADTLSDNSNAYFMENFDRYTDGPGDIGQSGSYMWGNSSHYTSPRTTIETAAASVFSLVTGRGGSGLAARTYFTAAQQQRDWVTPGRPTGDVIGTYSGAFVAQFYVRFPDDNGIMNGGKFFEMMYKNGSSGTDRIEFSIKTGSPRYFVVNAGNAGQVPGAEIGEQPVGIYPDSINDGAWHRITVSYKVNTTAGSPSSRDGHFKGWVDGVKVVDISNEMIGVTPTGGTKEWCSAADVDNIGEGTNHHVHHLTFPNVINNLTASFNIDYDDVTFWAVP